MKIVMAVLVLVLGVSGSVRPVLSLARQEGTAVPAPNTAASYPRLRQPNVFTYSELVTLGTTDTVVGKLRDKLHAITTTPFLSNEAYYRGARPHRPVVSQLGASLRLVAWNIERGLELDGIKRLFVNTEEFLRQAERNEAPMDVSQMRHDIGLLKSADVLVLNEVDWGLKRTGYRSVVRELGDALNSVKNLDVVTRNPFGLRPTSPERWIRSTTRCRRASPTTIPSASTCRSRSLVR